MPKIADVTAFEILDSRGNPTVKARITLDTGLFAEASVPSGASKGTHEAVELRDNDPKRYRGMGVLQSVESIHTKIRQSLVGKDVADQPEIDALMVQMDGSANKQNLGSNTILAVSLSVCRAAAASQNVPLYRYIAQLSGQKTDTHHVTPLLNIVNGGLHGCGTIDFQEFLLIPDSTFEFPEALRMSAEIYQLLKKMLRDTHHIYSVGDEGGFTPDYATNSQAIQAIIGVIELSNYTYGKDVFLGIDFASNSYLKDGMYVLESGVKSMFGREYIDFLVNLQKKFNLYLMEDPVAEDEWENWTELTQQIGSVTKIVGDDLLVTNIGRLEKAVSLKACNSILIKLNQIGTLSETLEVIKYARNSGLTIIVSHRSGETTDDFIADLAVGAGADFVKFGAPARGERVVKYNRLLEIYNDLKE